MLFEGHRLARHVPLEVHAEKCRWSRRCSPQTLELPLLLGVDRTNFGVATFGEEPENELLDVHGRLVLESLPLGLLALCPPAELVVTNERGTLSRLPAACEGLQADHGAP